MAYRRNGLKDVLRKPIGRNMIVRNIRSTRKYRLLCRNKQATYVMDLKENQKTLPLVSSTKCGVERRIIKESDQKIVAL